MLWKPSIHRHTVLFVLILHDQEWVVVEITEKCDIRLDSPVVLIWLEEFVAIEELH